MRCSAFTALGDAYSMRPDASSSDHAVADARRVLADVVVGDEGVFAAHDHPRETLESLAVHALERARATGRAQRGLAGHDGDHLTVTSHRDALHAHTVGLLPEADFAFDDLARTKGARRRQDVRSR